MHNSRGGIPNGVLWHGSAGLCSMDGCSASRWIEDSCGFRQSTCGSAEGGGVLVEADVCVEA